MFADLASYLPPEANEPQLQWANWEEMVAAFSQTVYPPMAMSRPQVPTTLPPPTPVASSWLENHSQRAVYPEFGLAGGTADFFQSSSTAVGSGYTGNSAPHQGLIQPTFYINHASFRQSPPALSTSAAPASANEGRSEQAVPAANAWSGVASAGGTGGRDEIGPQRLRRTQARASRLDANEPYAKAGTRDASGSAAQPERVGQTSYPGAEQENEVVERRTVWRGVQYRCHCGKWVLERRRAKHEPTHGVTWPCSICEVLNKDQRPLSRKDALKRHICMQHAEYKDLLERQELNLLLPSDTDRPTDKGALRQAMGTISAG